MSAKQAKAEQTAALPVRWDRNGKLRVWRVTSRDRGHWVMSKGCTMDGRKPRHASKLEANEEAGAVGFVSVEESGTYHYKKRLESGRSPWCRIMDYPIIVNRLKRRWKERKERKRHWFSLARSSKAVDEPDLTELLRALVKGPEMLKELEELRPAD